MGHVILMKLQVDLPLWTMKRISSGSSGRVEDGGSEKHEIYVAVFGGHLCYDLFLQGGGAMAPQPPPPISYYALKISLVFPFTTVNDNNLHARLKNNFV